VNHLDKEEEEEEEEEEHEKKMPLSVILYLSIRA
jgi:hypothetical protein